MDKVTAQGGGTRWGGWGKMTCPDGTKCKGACLCHGVSADGTVGVGGFCECVSLTAAGAHERNDGQETKVYLVQQAALLRPHVGPRTLWALDQQDRALKRGGYSPALVEAVGAYRLAQLRSALPADVWRALEYETQAFDRRARVFYPRR